MKKSFLILLSLTLVLTACGGAAEEEVVEEPAVVEEVETLDKPATTAAPVPVSYTHLTLPTKRIV